MKTKPSVHKLPRRDFLRTAGFAVAAFNIVPGSVLGLRGQTPASEKLNIAGIGVAGQGGSDITQFQTTTLSRCATSIGVTPRARSKNFPTPASGKTAAKCSTSRRTSTL